MVKARYQRSTRRAGMLERIILANADPLQFSEHPHRLIVVIVSLSTHAMLAIPVSRCFIFACMDIVET